MPRMLFFPLIHVKMPTIVGILTSMSGKNFMLNRVEHEKSFITSGLEPSYTVLQIIFFQAVSYWLDLRPVNKSQSWLPGMSIHDASGLCMKIIILYKQNG